MSVISFICELKLPGSTTYTTKNLILDPRMSKIASDNAKKMYIRLCDGIKVIGKWHTKRQKQCKIVILGILSFVLKIERKTHIRIYKYSQNDALKMSSIPSICELNQPRSSMYTKKNLILDLWLWWCFIHQNFLSEMGAKKTEKTQKNAMFAALFC